MTEPFRPPISRNDLSKESKQRRLFRSFGDAFATGLHGLKTPNEYEPTFIRFSLDDADASPSRLPSFRPFLTQSRRAEKPDVSSSYISFPEILSKSRGILQDPSRASDTPVPESCTPDYSILGRTIPSFSDVGHSLEGLFKGHLTSTDDTSRPQIHASESAGGHKRQLVPSRSHSDQSSSKSSYPGIEGGHSQELSSTTSYRSLPLDPLASTVNRDALLTYAQRLFMKWPLQVPYCLTLMFHPTNNMSFEKHDHAMELVRHLTDLKSHHPRHLPTLLLLGGAFYAMGDLASSLKTNLEILSIEPSCVEASFNIGAIMKSLNKPETAKKWWFKAMLSQPMYWDATDNLLNLVLEQHSMVSTSRSSTIYKQALYICRFIQSRLVDFNGRLLTTIPPSQIHRLQNIYCTSANLLLMLGGAPTTNVEDEYFQAIELVIRPPSPSATEVYTFRDLVIATCISAQNSLPGTFIPIHIAQHLGFNGPLNISEPGFKLMQAVHSSGKPLVDAVLQGERNALPMILLNPQQIPLLPMLLFPGSSGVLPSVCNRIDSKSPVELPQADVCEQTNTMTSKILLILARRFQDELSGINTVPGTRRSFHVTTSLVLLLYYLAVALAPSASGYNNLGAMISSLPTSNPSDVGGPNTTSACRQLARAYYLSGIHLEPNHPHLLTNLGSLLKEEDNLSGALQFVSITESPVVFLISLLFDLFRMYAKAIHQEPKLDVALTNMGNILRDMGHPCDAVIHYRRALAVNDRSESACGLANCLSSICDWHQLGWFDAQYKTDEQRSGSGRDRMPEAHITGWMSRLLNILQDELRTAYSQNIGILRAEKSLDEWLNLIESVHDRPLDSEQRKRWTHTIGLFYTDFDRSTKVVNEGGFLLRLIEWLQRRLQRKWYIHAYGRVFHSNEHHLSPPRNTSSLFMRPKLSTTMTFFSPPSVLPFHCFTYPVDPRTIRLVSHRNALRISHGTLMKDWLPGHVYPPPHPPFRGRLNVGYVSHDIRDHPLAHLMQSVFGFHDRNKLNVHVYATCPSDSSSYRRKIEAESQHFLDVSSWETRSIVERILDDKIHILVNLGGYTKGARNEIFAARPCPIQISLMGFPGTLAAGWCDYLVCDSISCPQNLSAGERAKTGQYKDPGLYVGAEADPESSSGDWVYTENFIYMPYTFMVTDHKQSFRGLATSYENAERRRAATRQTIFPELPSDIFIFANFNQLYKIDPVIFSLWLRILKRVPRSVLWLLRFPTAGEKHLLENAEKWAGKDVASRIRFTDVASKEAHVQRSRVAHLFLDTIECNAHTTATDVLWSGTPILTWPKNRYKMCSCVGASIAHATGLGSKMVVNSLREYEDRAVALATSVRRHDGELMRLRRSLHLNRDRMPLFDTARWTRSLEKGYEEAWKRWVSGAEFRELQEGDQNQESRDNGGCIWIEDDDVKLMDLDPHPNRSGHKTGAM